MKVLRSYASNFDTYLQFFNILTGLGVRAKLNVFFMPS